MKKWIIVIVVILVGLIIIGVLYDAGYLNFKWSTLSMVFAALAGPYMYIKNKLFNTNNVDTIDDMIRKAKDGLKVDEDHRAEFDETITQKETQIANLENQVTVFDTKLKELETKTQATHTEVKEMSSAEIAKAFETLYGNEKDE
jgi:septal ring factor EnvC (AmiA/AmiB activator)